MAESSSTPASSDKPVIVRVKRKALHSALDAFWLEIHERPLKKPLLDFGKLSLSEASSSRDEELNIKKVFVRRVETVVSSEDTFDVLRSFVPSSSDAFKSKEKNEDQRHSIKSVNKHDQLAKARERQEVLSRNARFEQIWRSRKGKNEAPEDEAIHEICKLYDVVRVDAVEPEVKIHEDKELDDSRMMAQYLPLLKEVLPTAAEEIENDISKQVLDGYAYDIYAVEDDTASTLEIDSNIPFPLVQVDDDDFYDGPDEDSEYETDDSNAENHPMNEYPDEETSEDELTSRSSDEEDLEDDEKTSSSSQSEKMGSGSQVSNEEDSGMGEWSDYAEDEEEQYW